MSLALVQLWLIEYSIFVFYVASHSLTSSILQHSTKLTHINTTTQGILRAGNGLLWDGLQAGSGLWVAYKSRVRGSQQGGMCGPGTKDSHKMKIALLVIAGLTGTASTARIGRPGSFGSSGITGLGSSGTTGLGSSGITRFCKEGGFLLLLCLQG